MNPAGVAILLTFLTLVSIWVVRTVQDVNDEE
jgi:hypothetical protein